MHFTTKIVTKEFKNHFQNIPRTFSGNRMSSVVIEVEQLIVCEGQLSKDKKTSQIVMERPISVRGVVLPLETKGRPPAPNPLAFDSLLHYIKSRKTRNQKFSVIAADSDRGHIFALELGGPNSNFNIVPQWNGYQEHGDWRRMEKKFKAQAKELLERGHSLYIEIQLEYFNLNLTHLQDQLIRLFSFETPADYAEDKIKKCLQIFGIPTAYSYNTCPCSIFIQPPKKHLLSISYVEYLLKVSCRIYQYKKKIAFKNKIAAVAKKLKDTGWSLKGVRKKHLIDFDALLFSCVQNYIDQGTFALSTITEEDIEDF